LDHAINANGKLEPFAADLVRRAKSYTEWSPSKTGVHVIGTGKGSSLNRKAVGAERQPTPGIGNNPGAVGDPTALGARQVRRH
jgi:hypothetical protein